MPERDYYTIAEAATVLRVSRVTIWRWLKAGRLTAVRLGDRVTRIRREDLEQAMTRVSPGRRLEPQLQARDLSDAAHFVQFYETDAFLLDTLTDYIGTALRNGDAAIVVATADHREGLEARLESSGIDLPQLSARGQYTALDAAETLASFMVDGLPGSQRFEEVIGGVLTRAMHGGPRLRIFGEMVALLAAEGMHAAALRLEQLWNELRQVHTFSLMCGYPIDGFDGEELTEVLAEVCAEHIRILPSEGCTDLPDPEDRLRAITDLQHRARSLEAEIAKRQQAEERIRRLQEITGHLSRYLETDQVLASIARSAADLLQVPVGAVFLLDRRAPDADFTLAAAYGIDEADARDLRLPRHASLAGRAIDQGQTLVVDDVRQTPGTALPALLTGETAGSEIAAPITAGTQTFGVVKAFSAMVRRFSPDDASLLSALAAAAAAALTNAQLYHEAQEAVRVRDEFLSAAAHDLKTPLTVVKGVSQLVQRQLIRTEMQGLERLLEGLATINETATKMGEQLDELLDLTRLQAGQPLELRRQPTDCVDLARRLTAEQQQVAERHQVRVETSLQELAGIWDAVRLRRVLDNLLSNAIKYSPAGGEVVVTVEREREDSTGDEWAVLSVRDQGLGIPAADLPHIFKRFRRATNVEGRIGGTGIGLTSARQIVEQHGGAIAVESEEGAGSTFTVRLPLASETAGSRDGAGARGSARCGPGVNWTP